MNSIILAAMLTLNPGYNNPGVAGEVVAIEAATSNATATVTVSAVDSLTLYTNATAQVVRYEPAWRVTVTNYEGGATWALDADAFPVVYVYKGETYTIADNSGLSFLQRTLSVVDVNTVPALADGYLFYTEYGFMEDKPIYGGTDAYIDSLTFNGQYGVSGTWPSLSKSATPYTYVTNVVGYLNYDDFKWTNGVSRIIGEPVRFDMPITNTVVTASVAAETYAVTNAIATVTTAAHFGQATTNAYIYGGGLYVTGAGEGDIIRVIFK